VTTIVHGFPSLALNIYNPQLLIASLARYHRLPPSGIDAGFYTPKLDRGFPWGGTILGEQIADYLHRTLDQTIKRGRLGSEPDDIVAFGPPTPGFIIFVRINVV
jgi:hypothetical protein